MIYGPKEQEKHDFTRGSFHPRQDAVRPARMTMQDRMRHKQEMARKYDEFIAGGGVIQKEIAADPVYTIYPASGHTRGY